MRVVVVADSVSSITRISDGRDLTSDERTAYFTIDSLFGLIHSGAGDSIVVRYDETFGYPTYLDINPQLHPVDGGVLYQTSDLMVSR
jgi:hypothetical protein